MRKSLVALLMIATAAPALAAPGDRDRGDRSERRATAERASSDDDSDERRKASNQSNESSRSDSVRPRSDGGRRAVQQDVPPRAPIVSRSAEGRRDAVRPEGRRDMVRTERQSDSVRTWRERERQRTTRPSLERREAPVFGGSEARRAPVVRQESRRPAVDLSQRTVASRWRNDWRRDRRYDWRSYRSRHNSLFRIGFYYDPFGYNYRRFGYGHQLYPAYYGSRYWLSDPFMYRLPPAWGPYRWVRYWDDALLVDTRSGMVVDVIYDFFW